MKGMSNMNKKIKKSGLMPGDKVIMVKCAEAEKYKDRIWIVRSEPWDVCGSEVVLLEGYSGGFATEMLKKMEASDGTAE
jgi:hypothetical protein